FDLILLDNTMPHMDGLQLAVRIHTVRPDLPVVIMTGFTDSLSQELVRELGATDLMMKPIDKDKLARTVRHALDGVA
ncbi:MAG TPA: response regulator, partial [Candidatus Hydrogenedentes bacterium]|nr:response regulator [Candidatus Hydrogenedentota bacterium]